MITINAKLLHAIAKWTHNDHDRAALRCVLFDKGVAVACDGHLGPMRFEGAGGSEFVIMPMRP